ncbi:MAG TPA: nitrite reductase small subunit NirD [Euzebya sp.]|nr:nitrite reductase small subunit NirD [Euzebya sp.]
MTPARQLVWHPVCPLARILPESGVAVRLDGHPVAIFRLRDDRVLAVDHTDPFTGSNVIARGIVGEHGGVPTVASPLHKQRFSLLDGACLDDDDVRLGHHPTTVINGVVQVALG